MSSLRVENSPTYVHSAVLTVQSTCNGWSW